MKPNLPSEANVLGPTTEDAKKAAAKPGEERWTRACTDLKSALSTWDELAKAPVGPSKDEQQVEKMKQLLKELAKQVAELS